MSGVQWGVRSLAIVVSVALLWVLACRSESTGDLTQLSMAEQRAFAGGPEFLPLPAPRPGDWLAEHSEPGQTFGQWLSAGPNLPHPGRRTIYLVGLGDLDDRLQMDTLVDYTESFFGLPVVVLPPIAADATAHRSRVRAGHRQLHTVEVLRNLRGALPTDAYCLLAVTMEDLYPADDWQFVFGQASLADRVGVFSFTRYLGDLDGAEPTQTAVLYRRALQTMSHEIGHMFGIQHCTAYACNMNGSNSLRESDTQPMHLCPVCLRKIHRATGVDLLKRYRALLAIYERLAIDEAAAVASRLAARIEAPPAGSP